MATRRNEVVDFPSDPVSGIPNAVVIKKVQSGSSDGAVTPRRRRRGGGEGLYPVILLGKL